MSTFICMYALKTGLEFAMQYSMPRELFETGVSPLLNFQRKTLFYVDTKLN